MSHKLSFDFGIVSETGNVRESNQDSAFASENLLIVADGMGGHAGGDTASAITVNLMKQLSEKISPKGIFKSRPNTKDSTLLISQTIGQIYLQMIDSIDKNPNLAGMGTTMTVILRTADSLVTAHLGDSRAYLLRGGELTQVTHDHTFVQTLIDQGHITDEEGRNHPQKNVVMKVLGDFDLDIEPDLTFQQIIRGDRWFLCSDGIISGLRDGDIAHVLSSVINPQEAAQKLVDLALEAGSTDNVTAIVADVLQTGSFKEKTGELAGSVLRPELYQDASQLKFEQNSKEVEGIIAEAIEKARKPKNFFSKLFAKSEQISQPQNFQVVQNEENQEIAVQTDSEISDITTTNLKVLDSAEMEKFATDDVVKNETTAKPAPKRTAKRKSTSSAKKPKTDSKK